MPFKIIGFFVGGEKIYCDSLRKKVKISGKREDKKGVKRIFSLYLRLKVKYHFEIRGRGKISLLIFRFKRWIFRGQCVTTELYSPCNTALIEGILLYHAYMSRTIILYIFR